MARKKLILGLETSCDETAASVVAYDGQTLSVLSNIAASQIGLHKLTGGVVPEVSAREHVTTVIPTIKLALKKAKVTQENLTAIAVTAGPGLLPALMTGVDTANALALSLNIPVIPVQHITGHIYANFLTDQKNFDINLKKIKFPALALVVSGAHTELIIMRDQLSFRKVGATLDDAAGEAFDKIGRILGLPYPGGPKISARAQTGNPQAFDFPRPLLREDNLDFSFAGLKTAVLYKIQHLEEAATGKKSQRQRLSTPSPIVLDPQTIDDIAASAQQAIIDTLVGKTEKAVRKYKPKTFTFGGGVAANALLRQRLANLFATTYQDIDYYAPQSDYTIDNAAMIAAMGHIILASDKRIPPFAKADPQWEI